MLGRDHLACSKCWDVTILRDVDPLSRQPQSSHTLTIPVSGLKSPWNTLYYKTVPHSILCQGVAKTLPHCKEGALCGFPGHITHITHRKTW